MNQYILRSVGDAYSLMARDSRSGKYPSDEGKAFITPVLERKEPLRELPSSCYRIS